MQCANVLLQCFLSLPQAILFVLIDIYFAMYSVVATAFIFFSFLRCKDKDRVKNKQTRKNSVILSNEVFSTIPLQCISLTDSTGQSISCALFSFWCALYFDKYVSLLALHRVSCLSQSVDPHCHSCFVFFIYPCLFYFLFFVPKHGRIFIWHFQLFI